MCAPSPSPQNITAPPQLSGQAGPHRLLRRDGQGQDSITKGGHCHLEAKLRQWADLGMGKDFKLFYLKQFQTWGKNEG